MNPQRTVLFLNATNLKTLLTYPYAFVQVSEIADRFNIRVVRKDMYGIPKNQWAGYIRKLLNKNNFDMVLITIRNTDTCVSEEYHPSTINRNYHQEISFRQREHSTYYPIEATNFLIQTLRKITDLPIAIGGYAFSIMPEKIMKYLQPDYGVSGGPDAFFEHFEDILEKQNLNRVANLWHYRNKSLIKGVCTFFPPAKRKEYTNEIIADRNEFYSTFLGEDVESNVPLEVVRGCTMKCTYCSEPLIKGTKLQYRDLDVIEDEINFLGKYGLYKLEMICSEINSGGNEFVMNLADRLIKINEEREDYEKVSWYALFLMTLSADELKHIRKAGFLGGSNDVVSLDDANISAVKGPLKSNDVLDFFAQAKKQVKEEFKLSGKKFYSLEERIFRAPQSLNPDDFVNSWNIFLGNTEATPETIRLTLKSADDTGLYQLFDSCHVIKATRLWDYIQPTDELLKHTWSSVKGVIKNSYNEMYPSFVYPPALLRHFGSAEDLEEFFVQVGDTYLSRKHLYKKDWNWFLANNLDLETFLSWWISSINSGSDFNNLTRIPEVLDFLTFLRNSPSAHNIKLFFNPTPDRKTLMNFATNIAIKIVLFSQEKNFTPVLRHLGLPPRLKATLNLSPYKFAVKLFERYSDRDDLLSDLNDNSLDRVLSKFCVDYLLYLNATPLRAEYQIFFCL